MEHPSYEEGRLAAIAVRLAMSSGLPPTSARAALELACRMIDDSPASEDFKQVMRGKLDALLALAEATDCRRVRLLGYFGEPSGPCGNCDNCLSPPQVWDGTDAARKLLADRVFAVGAAAELRAVYVQQSRGRVEAEHRDQALEFRRGGEGVLGLRLEHDAPVDRADPGSQTAAGLTCGGGFCGHRSLLYGSSITQQKVLSKERRDRIDIEHLFD